MNFLLREERCNEFCKAGVKIYGMNFLYVKPTYRLKKTKKTNTESTS